MLGEVVLPSNLSGFTTVQLGLKFSLSSLPNNVNVHVPHHPVLVEFSSIHKYLTSVFPETVRLATSVSNQFLHFEQCSDDKWSTRDLLSHFVHFVDPLRNMVHLLVRVDHSFCDSFCDFEEKIYPWITKTESLQERPV